MKLMDPNLSLHHYYLSLHAFRINYCKLPQKYMKQVIPRFNDQLLTYLMCYWFDSLKTTDEVDTLLKSFKKRHFHVFFMKDRYNQYYDITRNLKKLRKFRMSNTATPPIAGT
ncbi:uncharacterized protein PHALS_15331 [Plasmopara halstedii]|uniref:Uncharacterized protein n=1 Tax=Plasmopara halstedii TaxID=4781 RepID=A0A0P1ACM1_PLAHL|nr:uncharacterized protein PHALS_15331 [Plasmopara halstedii]CEG38710.1 hypothetical protein PHALS_15331 [Plasmopara halstedii]|eukprot:XP_024575079.1 hypothetical protein PHALS_15331 [Plasmopara halstedii]